MSQPLLKWSLFLDTTGKVNFRSLDATFAIHSVTISRSGGWRIFSSPESSVLCILTQNVRCENYPDFVIKQPRIISSFFVENGVKIN